MRKKFKIIDPDTGEKWKCPSGGQVVMTAGGVFFWVSKCEDYYGSYTRPLHERLPKYDVIWSE